VNPGRHSGKPATNRLSYGMAYFKYIKKINKNKKYIQHTFMGSKLTQKLYKWFCHSVQHIEIPFGKGITISDNSTKNFINNNEEDILICILHLRRKMISKFVLKTISLILPT
jgi:hypothetical protein